MDTSLLLLSQFCETITEFIIGPHTNNQGLLLNAETNAGEPVLECCPEILRWLQDRQNSLLKVSSEGMSEERQEVRRKRLVALLRAELGTLQLVDGVLEGYVRSNFVRVTRMFLHNYPAMSLRNGFEVLLSNLASHHLAMQIFTGEQFAEERHLTEQVALKYFVLISKLGSNDETVRAAVDTFLLTSDDAAAAMQSARMRVIQVQIKVTGMPDHYSASSGEFDPRTHFQMLYFVVPQGIAGLDKLQTGGVLFQNPVRPSGLPGYDVAREAGSNPARDGGLYGTFINSIGSNGT